ncbi:hypothetical protein ACFYXM_11930 [Streptomyces sp. NPDC002476]
MTELLTASTITDDILSIREGLTKQLACVLGFIYGVADDNYGRDD